MDVNNAANNQNENIPSKRAKKPERRLKKRWLGAVAVVLAAAVLGGMFLRPGAGLAAYTVVEAEYPKTVSPARNEPVEDLSSLQPFFVRSTQTFLTGERGENRVYSPLNVYMALSMLAQVTRGESQEQILSLLGSGSMDALRWQAGDMWEKNYRDDKEQTLVMANSLWLDDGLTFRREALETLAREFHASCYQGEMGSAQFNKALQSWLEKETGGLLKKQAASLELSSETVLALASTVCFKARWEEEFSKGAAETRTFHAPGGDVEANFMYQQESQEYYWGEKFSAVCQPFDHLGAMWLLLPDEGVAPEDLLLDQEAAGFLFAAGKDSWEQQKVLSVRKYVPKFDVASRFDLEEGLKELGVTGVFDPAKADFSPLTDEAAAITQADHAVRVAIDEEGCTAAAYTVMIASGVPPLPDGEADFILDRPFLFCITGREGLPLFVGIVNHPAGR